MELQIDDPLVVDDLIAFLRDGGCVAVLRGAVRLEVTPSPTAGGDADRAKVRGLVEAWQTGHPGVSVTVSG